MMPKLKKKSVKKSTKKSQPLTESREVIYKEVLADVCVGDTAITADDAKELLGWEEVAGGELNYSKEIFSLAKKKVICRNNTINRTVYASVVLTLKQEILRRRWILNGEPIIVGKTGQLLNGQHTLLALILANQEWEADKERWAEYWETPPTIDKVVVSGIDEADQTVNTMDTCKPRSLVDVIGRSEYFSKLPEGEGRAIARLIDNAISLLWHRTGAKLDAFAPRKTHSESMDFLARHSKIIEAAKHIYEEDGKNKKIKRYLNPGYAAGLLYLMGSSDTDPEEYRKAAHRDESLLNWDKWDKACNLFVLLAAGGKETSAIRHMIAQSIEEGALSVSERWAIIANSWLAYSQGKSITEAALRLQYTEDEDGVRHLTYHPSVGGIDLGDPSTADEELIAAVDPTPAEIEEKASKIRNKKEKGEEKTKPTKAKPIKAVFRPTRAGLNWAAGDIAWVRDQDGEHYLGQIDGDSWNCDDGECHVFVRTAEGKRWEVQYDDLSLEVPTSKPKPAVVDKPMGVSPKSSSKKAKRLILEKKLPTDYQVGDHVWVDDPGVEPWKGKIVERSKGAVKVMVDQGFQGCGTVRVVWLRYLCRQQPKRTKSA
jgi:hypothetical protein